MQIKTIVNHFMYILYSIRLFDPVSMHPSIPNYSVVYKSNPYYHMTAVMFACKHMKLYPL